VYIKRELQNYIDDLASKSAVPGGGSASALAGILGMALSTMVANFTRDKKIKSALRPLIKKNKILQKRTQFLIDQDVVVFLRLQDALKLPKDALKRPAITQKCFKDAANVPFEICSLCYQAAKITEKIAKVGNVNLISDTGGAIYLLNAAYKSAELNVMINLKYIKDKNFIKTKKARMVLMSREMLKIKSQILKRVKECL
jgi:formiminotetrahydrofolate cyclodeaminase